MKIFKSLITIMAVATLAVGATSAYFSDSATIADNTFTAGTLEIRVNGQETKMGATFSPVVPGETYNSPEYHINNYGSPHFAGPSNLTAKYLTIRNSAPVSTPDNDLWDNVMIKVETNRGWATWQLVYEGKLKDMPTSDLLSPRWSELAPGNSQMLKYQAWLPDTGTDQSKYMGDSLVWDFIIEGRTS